MKMLVTTSANLEAAHCLKGKRYSDEENIKIYGKCSNLHGHNYKLFVTVSGEVQEDGMIINFKEMKEIIREKIVERFDHKYLNEVMQEVPTAENMCIVIWNILEGEFNVLNIELYELKLYETDNSFITIKK